MIKILCILALAALATASDVIVSGDDDFAEVVGGEDLSLVKFYAPWCGHCKKLAPEFDRAATELKSNDPPIPLIKVDCTAEGKEVCSKYDVKGFPTLKAFKNGEVAFEYQGPRDADGIVKYMKSKAGPTSKHLASAESVEKFVSSSEHSVVGFFTNDNSELYKLFLKAADALNEDFRFGHTTDSAAGSKYADHADKIVIFQPARLQNKFEESQLVFDQTESLYEVKNFINGKVHGLCGHRTTSNSEQFRKPLVVAYYDVDYVKNTKGTNYWRNRVMKVAKKFSEAGKGVNFAISNKDDFQQEVDEYGLQTDGDKPVVAARDSKDRKYAMKDEFSMDNLEQFTNDLLDGKLKAFIKSEAVPEDNDGPVKVIVGENFDEIVNDESKDVLIEFYAPWCGHCKSLAPKYDELGEKLSGESSVTIAKMDATANDVPSQYDVRGFPTIYYAPKGSKSNPKKYEGGREVKDFIKYLAAESTDGLEGYDRSGKKQKAEL